MRLLLHRLPLLLHGLGRRRLRLLCLPLLRVSESHAVRRVGLQRCLPRGLLGCGRSGRRCDRSGSRTPDALLLRRGGVMLLLVLLLLRDVSSKVWCRRPQSHAR